MPDAQQSVQRLSLVRRIIIMLAVGVLVIGIVVAAPKLNRGLIEQFDVGEARRKAGLDYYGSCSDLADNIFYEKTYSQCVDEQVDIYRRNWERQRDDSRGELAAVGITVAVLLGLLGVAFFLFGRSKREHPLVVVAASAPSPAESAAPPSQPPAPTSTSQSSTPTPGSLEDRLARLDTLRSSGLISDEEYAHQRERLLNEI